MKVLYFTDGYHDDRFLTGDGKSGFVEELIALLCTPHTEEYKVRRLLMEELEDNPAIPDYIIVVADHGWKGNQLDEYDFNTLWTFTEEF